MSESTLECDAPMPPAYEEPPVDLNVIKSPTRSYQLVQFLGKGAYGKVYEGRVLEFGQVCVCPLVAGHYHDAFVFRRLH